MRTQLFSKSGFFVPRFTAVLLLLLSAGLLSVLAASGGSGNARQAQTSGGGSINAASQPPFVPVPNSATSGGLSVSASVITAGGWVRPGETYPILLKYNSGSAPVAGATISLTLPSSAVFLQSTPAATTGNGTAGSPLVYVVPALAAGTTGQIVIEARAKNLTEDPEVMWKDLSASFSVAATGQPAQSAQTHGPKVTTLESARYGDRPFPVVMVQYQDIKHCTGAGTPYPECTGNHTAAAFDTSLNSRTTGTSIWQLFNDMSFGQLYPDGKVNPAPNSPDTPFTATPGYPYKWSTLSPSGTCTGATLAPPTGSGQPAYTNRIENGWYLLPGTQGYYGSDGTGHALLGALTGQGLLFGIDNACGPTGKIAYDAAALADPDIDYNDFDLDKDGVVDFFIVAFAGDGGNGNTSVTGLNNVWPHSSDLRAYFTDANGITGYVSNDQFRNRLNQLMYYTDATRSAMTTTPTAFPVYVRVGPYNADPEASVESVSTIAHEYAHALGLPDFYSTGSRQTYGSWDIGGADYFQYMTVFSRQEMGWVVPKPVTTGTLTLTESKFDTGKIDWTRPDGTFYTLSGSGIHNAEVYRAGLPPRLLIDKVPSGTHAWYSGSGNAFGCPADGGGHNLDLFIPDLKQYASASAVTLKFKHFYEIEWDFDYGFVLVSDDGGRTWTSLASQNGSTTPSTINPNANACQSTYGNGITGVSDGDPNNDTQKRLTGDYSGAKFIDDQFDLSAYKGKEIILRFSYATDAGLAKRGWFIDDMEITADSAVVYKSDFEASQESTRIFPNGWARISSADGSPADHAYYIELRDRISNDFDGKKQSGRGAPTWEPGVAMVYTDEAHGYGNFGVDDPPAETIVDSVPQPGSETPNLDDAAFTLARPTFNGCTHIDNYTDPNGPNGLWKLPDNLRFTVTSMSGMTGPAAAIPPTPATATLIAEVNPDCKIQYLPPELSIGTDYEKPDTDGSYTLSWTRPTGASGPDLLQVATTCGASFTDDAESGLGNWTVSSEGTYAGLNWQTSSGEKPNHPGTTFRARAAEGAMNASAILTSKNKFDIPSSGTTTLVWEDWSMNEGDDATVVEVSDGGTTWNPIYTQSRSALAPDAATAFTDEPLFRKEADLTPYKGKSIFVRFRYFVGPDDRAGSTPLGWYIDNIQITSANWGDLINTADTSYRESKPSGNYCYRVRTAFPVGTATLPTGFSNIVNVTVAPGVNPPPPPSPGVLRFSQATYDVGENNGTATIKVVRAEGSAGTVTVDYATSDGSATAGSDYTAAKGTLTFGPGEVEKQFSVAITDDTADENDETVNLTLSNPTNQATLGTPSAAFLRIIDNEVPPGAAGTLQFSAAEYSVNENAGSAIVTVARTGGTAGTVTVSYTTSDGSATANSDYTPASGTLTFADGETTKSFSVSVTDDTSAEPDETVLLSLSNPAGGATLGSPSRATLTIFDGDRGGPPAQLLNISTRLRVQAGDKVGIAGFIITGNVQKRVLLRGLGPSVAVNGQPVAGRLQDPVIDLYDGNGVLMTSNDNWKDSPERADIESSGLAPQNDAEAAIARTLNPGAYTGIISGKSQSEGIGLVEVYDRDRGGASEMANISTRGVVESNDNVLIGGFIAGAQDGATNVIVRAIGPSLTARGVAGALPDPTIELVNKNGDVLGSNDDWKASADQAEISRRGLAPQDERESAAFKTLAPGEYTAVVRGKTTASGVALVEIYNVK